MAGYCTGCPHGAWDRTSGGFLIVVFAGILLAFLQNSYYWFLLVKHKISMVNYLFPGWVTIKFRVGEMEKVRLGQVGLF